MDMVDYTQALRMQNYLLIVAAIVASAVTILWIRRRRNSNGLDYLGTVSQRWISDERASSHDGLR
jgi:hypothetical protein